MHRLSQTRTDQNGTNRDDRLALYRTLDIDEVACQAEALSQMLCKSPDPESFGGMMTGDKKCGTRLAREVNRGLRDFSTDKHIGAESDCTLEHPLTATGAPRDATNRASDVSGVDHHRSPTESAGQRRRQLLQRHWGSRPAVTRHILLAETPFHGPPRTTRQLDVVANLGMRVERQVVGNQVDIRRQQGLQARLAKPGNGTRLAAPEPAVMDEDCIRATTHRFVNQRLIGRHPADHTLHLGATFHL